MPSATMRTSLGAVEPVGDAAHLALERLPVDQHGAVEELLELLERHARVLRERLRRVLAADPGLLVRHERKAERPVGALNTRRALLRDVGALAGVLGRVDRDPRIDVLHHVALDIRHLVEQLLRRVLDPRGLLRAQREPQPRDRMRAAERHLPDDLLVERPGQRLRLHEHLPARLDADAAVDEQLRVPLEPRVRHRRRNLAAGGRTRI